MARINVDDDWYSDPLERRAALIQALADKPRDLANEADGAALKAWRLAQKYWKDGAQSIPADVWKRARLDALLETGLAEWRDGAVYVRGTEERAEWVKKKVEAGRKGGKAPKKEPGLEALLKQIEAMLKHSPGNAQALLKQIEAHPEQCQANAKPLAPAPAPVPAPPPIPTLTISDPPAPEPIPEAPSPPPSRSHDEILASKIVSALRWEGENFAAAVKKLPDRSMRLIAAYGGARNYSEGLALAWRACRRKGFSGDIGGWDDDKAQEVLEEFRRIARRLRTGGSSEDESPDLPG